MSVYSIWHDSLQCDTCGAIHHAPASLNGELTSEAMANRFYEIHNNCKRQPREDVKFYIETDCFTKDSDRYKEQPK